MDPTTRFARCFHVTVAAVLVCGLHDARGQCDPQENKITASDGSTSSQFGYSVAIDGDVAVVGAWLADPNGSDSGAAYVYRFDGSDWEEEAILTPQDGGPEDTFGSALAVSGNIIVVGASGRDSAGYNSNSGAAVVFRFNGVAWNEESTLIPNDIQANDDFGSAVAASGNRVVIGSPGDDDVASNAGSAYVFTFNGSSWTQSHKMLAPGGGGFDHFGKSVGLSGDRAVIGSHLHFNAQDVRTGAAYVFRRTTSTWTLEEVLEASDSATYDYFGYSVAISGDLIAVGSYQDDDNGADSGSAYVFRRNGTTWIEETKLDADDGVPNDYFGHAIAISGEGVVAGAYSNGWPGAAYSFKHDGGGDWSQTAKLAPSDWGMNDYFGAAVALSGDVAIVGSFHDDDLGLSSGSAYLYSTDCSDKCPGGNCGAACQSIADCADLDGDGLRDDTCTWWACTGTCTPTTVPFGDLGGPNGGCEPDGSTDGNDRFHALNCFSDQDTAGGVDPGYPCEASPPLAYNVDAGGEFGHCAADGICDGHDAFHTLNTFNGSSPCTCGAPAPDAPVAPLVVGGTAVRLQPSRKTMHPDGQVAVTVELVNGLEELRGYQLHLGTSGGESGTLELVDIIIELRRGQALAEPDWEAFNVYTSQVLVGLDGPGMPTHANAYLATFVYQASPDAKGVFTVELQHDDEDPSQRTFLFCTDPQAKIDILSATDAEVEVLPQYDDRAGAPKPSRRSRPAGSAKTR